jgi:hypothetical protein
MKRIIKHIEFTILDIVTLDASPPFLPTCLNEEIDRHSLTPKKVFGWTNILLYIVFRIYL